MRKKPKGVSQMGTSQTNEPIMIFLLRNEPKGTSQTNDPIMIFFVEGVGGMQVI